MNELEYFKNCNGIVFGRFGRDVESYVGYESVEEMLKDTVVNRLNIPIIFDADISHKGPSMTIINGSIIDIEVEDGKAKINMSLK
jgi:muramoyltetrapeptide carboxypeptidase LdcA involved in peptidoglycan recycling